MTNDTFIIKYRIHDRLRLESTGDATRAAARRLEAMRGVDRVEVHTPSHSIVVRYRSWLTSEEEIMRVLNDGPGERVREAPTMEASPPPPSMSMVAQLAQRRDALRTTLERLGAERARTVAQIELLRRLQSVYSSALEAEGRIPSDWSIRSVGGAATSTR